MKEIILNIVSFLGSDIRTRSRIFEIVARMNEPASYIFDMAGVEFISRSFADELISLMEQPDKKIRLLNVSGEINDLLRVVESGRKNTHSSTPANMSVKELSDMRDVELFFS